MALFLLLGCERGQKKRPIGFAKLGPVEALRSIDVKEVFEHALLLRQDEQGFYAMSTLCSHDLRRLKARRDGDAPILFCDVCGSEFGEMGEVIKGPAIKPIPFFNLLVAESVAGGPKDTLYARIGVEVDPTWRLAIRSNAQDQTKDNSAGK